MYNHTALRALAPAPYFSGLKVQGQIHSWHKLVNFLLLAGAVPNSALSYGFGSWQNHTAPGSGSATLAFGSGYYMRIIIMLWSHMTFLNNSSGSDLF